MLTPFGKAIRKARIDYGLTLKDVADKADVSSSYLSAIENGKKPLTNEFVNVLLSVMGLPEERNREIIASAATHIHELKLNHQGRTTDEIEFAMMFARKFESGSFDLDNLKKLLGD